MFSVGQTIVLGLAGSIYVFGAAFLLGGRSMLKAGCSPSSDTDGGSPVQSGIIDGSPYFVPVLDGATNRALSPSGTKAPGGAGRIEGAMPDPRAASSRQGVEGVSPSLKRPICLN